MPAKFRSLLAGVAALTAVSPVTAQEWKSGWGMGVSEASVQLGPGNEIMVSCTGGSASPVTGVRVTLGGNPPPPNSLVTLFVDGQDPLHVPMNAQGNLGSSSSAEASWFAAVTDLLTTNETVYVRFADGAGARFPLTGAAQAIRDCPPDFWQ